MKKYRVTEKHSLLKEDIILSNYKDDPGMKTWFYTPHSDYKVLSFGSYDISKWLKLGWIEEIQEPEFTKDDMLKFARYTYTVIDTAIWDEMLKKWIKENK
jgi:hypothetical protein